MNEGDVLFVDEIHRMSRPAEEMLYLAMEDFRVDVVIGKGPGATAIPLEIPPFTLVGATTRAGLLPGPAARPVRLHRPPRVLRARRARPDRAPLGRAARRRPRPDEGAAEIASRSRGTPRIANRLLRRVRDYAQVRADGVVTLDVARAALELYEVDELGLDRLDRAVLDVLCRRFGGGPVGVSHARRRRRRGARDRRGGRRAVPGPASASWPVRRAAGSPPPPPGATSG